MVSNIFWLVLSDEQMSKGWPFSLLNDEQMSNWVGVRHLPVFSPLFGEDFQFDKHIFQIGWFNHQLEDLPLVFLKLAKLCKVKWFSQMLHIWKIYIYLYCILTFSII